MRTARSQRRITWRPEIGPLLRRIAGAGILLSLAASVAVAQSEVLKDAGLLSEVAKLGIGFAGFAAGAWAVVMVVRTVRGKSPVVPERVFDARVVMLVESLTALVTKVAENLGEVNETLIRRAVIFERIENSLAAIRADLAQHHQRLTELGGELRREIDASGSRTRERIDTVQESINRLPFIPRAPQ